MSALHDDLTEIKSLYLILEDVFWRFNDMTTPDEDDESQVSQEYRRIHEAMDEIIGSAEVHLLSFEVNHATVR